MAVTSVIKIEIDDTDFKKFLASTKGLKIGATPNQKQTREEEKEFKKKKKQWIAEDRQFKSFTDHLKDATKSLAKWSAITAGLGIGGAYAAGRLGNSIEQQRYSARGLGISTAEQSAFKLNYRSLVDTETMLSKVADAMSDYSKRGSLYAAGLSESDIAGKSAEQVAEALVPLIKQKFEQNPTEQGAQAFHLLDLVGGMADLRRLQSARSDEIASIQKQNAEDKRQIALSAETQQKWIELSQQATRAGNQIEIEFVKALVNVAPELTSLSKALIEDIKVLNGSNGFKDGIKELSSSVHILAGYLGSESFKKDIEGFMTGIHKVAGYFGLGDQSDVEVEEFNKAVAKGDVNLDFKADLNEDERKQMAHEWYAEKQRKSEFMHVNPPEKWGEVNENSAIGKGKKFLNEQADDLKRYLQKQSYSPVRQPSFSITNNSSADVSRVLNGIAR